MNGEFKILYDSLKEFFTLELQSLKQINDERFKARCIEEEDVKNKINIIVKEIGLINNRCFDRTEDYTRFKDHLKDFNSMKKLWQDRNFKILCGLVSPVYIVLIGMIIKMIWK